MTPTLDIRETFLTVISEQSADAGADGNLQTNSLLPEVGRRVAARGNIELEQAILSQFQELFRTGYLAWGHNLSNPNPPFIHVTAVGRRALQTLSRDPANPTGYRRHLSNIADLTPMARDYLVVSEEFVFQSAPGTRTWFGVWPSMF